MPQESKLVLNFLEVLEANGSKIEFERLEEGSIDQEEAWAGDNSSDVQKILWSATFVINFVMTYDVHKMREFQMTNFCDFLASISWLVGPWSSIKIYYSVVFNFFLRSNKGPD